MLLSSSIFPTTLMKIIDRSSHSSITRRISFMTEKALDYYIGHHGFSILMNSLIYLVFSMTFCLIDAAVQSKQHQDF